MTRAAAEKLLQELSETHATGPLTAELVTKLAYLAGGLDAGTFPETESDRITFKSYDFFPMYEPIVVIRGLC